MRLLLILRTKRRMDLPTTITKRLEKLLALMKMIEVKNLKSNRTIAILTLTLDKIVINSKWETVGRNSLIKFKSSEDERPIRF